MKRHPHSNIGHSSLVASAPPRGASRGSRWLCLAACAFAGTACEGAAPRDLGSSSAPFTLDAPFFSETSEFIGTWSGSAEDTLGLNGDRPTYHFPSGSAQIVLEVEAAPDDGGVGPLQGSLRFGSGAPLPAPTDPESGYPPGVSYDALLAYDDSGVAFVDSRALPPFEGVDYPVGSRGQFTASEVPGSESEWTTTAADGVVSFTFSGNQPLDAWCRLQTPYPYPFPSGYGCIPNTGGGFDIQSPGTDAMCGLWGPPDTSNCSDPSEFSECIEFGEPIAYINCDKVSLCSTDDYCTCSETGCSATETGSRLTVRRVGDELVGVFENTVFVNERNLRVPLGEVRLQRTSDE